MGQPKTAKEKFKELLEAEAVPPGSGVAMVNIERFTNFVADEMYFDEAYDDEGWDFP